MKKFLLFALGAAMSAGAFQAKAYDIYAYNNAGWDEVAVYAWYDGATDTNILGGWPGTKMTETKKIGNYEFLYVECSYAGAMNLIFNNNNNGSQCNYNGGAITLTEDLYVEITATGANKIDPQDFTPAEPEKPTTALVYLYDGATDTKYSPDYLSVYFWGDGGNASNAWPGSFASSVEVINGVPFMVFEYEVYSSTPEQHMIVTNKGHYYEDNDANAWQADGPVVTLTETPLYVQLNADATVSEIDDIDSFTATFAAPSALYIIGNLQAGEELLNWNIAEAPAFTKGENNVFTIEGVQINAAEESEVGYFSLISLLSEDSDWDAVNDGAHRFGPLPNGVEAALGEAIPFINVANSSWSIEPGVYDITVNFDDVTISLAKSATEPEPEPEPETIEAPEALYLLGNLAATDGEWLVAKPLTFGVDEAGTTFTMNEVAFVAVDDNTVSYFTLTNIDSEDWDVLNEGTHRYGVGEVTVGTPKNLEYCGDASLNVEPGTYDITVVFADGKATLTLKDSKESGVSSFESNENAPVEYFNLQGVRVCNPQNGIYIIRQGNSVKKAVIK